MTDKRNAGSLDVRSDRRADATLASLPRDTGSSNNNSTAKNASIVTTPSGEIEVETEALHRPKARHAGRFLKGPIPLRVIAAASRLPGRALAVLLAIHHQTALTRNPVVTLPKSLLTELGVTKHGKARVLHALEDAGLVRVERQLGRSPKIRLTT